MKGKTVLVFYHSMTTRKNGDINSVFLNWALVQGERQINGPPTLLQRKEPWHSMGRELGGLQRRSGRCREEINVLQLSGIEFRFVYCPAPSSYSF
jgi:hypothetical protein